MAAPFPKGAPGPRTYRFEIVKNLHGTQLPPKIRPNPKFQASEIPARFRSGAPFLKRKNP